eukprot:2582660-Pyramimonas_sp.AAC.1
MGTMAQPMRDRIRALTGPASTAGHPPSGRGQILGLWNLCVGVKPLCLEPSLSSCRLCQLCCRRLDMLLPKLGEMSFQVRQTTMLISRVTRGKAMQGESDQAPRL